MTKQTTEAIRQAVILERSKELCRKLFNKEVTYMKFEKTLLTFKKLYDNPTAAWADKYFK